MSTRIKIHQIQGLRALAAVLVVIFHAKLLSGGFIGVDIFYVISGFLITGLIISEMERSRTFNFKAFYLRRAKRLLPASLGILVFTAVAAWLILPPILRANLGKDVVAASLYISNYLFAWWQNDYQNLNATPSPVIHYWSLAVEEQFYIFWPILVFAFWKIGGRKMVGIGIAVISVASFLFSLYLTSTNPIWAFYSLPTRAWELGVGALILFLPERVRVLKTRNRTLLVWVGLLLLIYSMYRFSERTPFPGYNAMAPTIGAALMIAFIASWPPALNDLSKLSLVQWLGEISYPFYLWHWPLLVLPSSRFGRPLTLMERLLLIIATAIAADLTHRFIEKPIHRREYSPQATFRIGTLATATCAIVGVLIMITNSNTIDLNNGKSISIAQVMERPAIYLDGCHVNNGEVLSQQCTYGEVASKKRIVLYGDSHAAQWFPALEKLANQYGFALINLTKSACPAPEVEKVEIGAYKNSDCFAWRANAIERINAMNPDAVILSGFQYFDVPRKYSSREFWWAQGQQKAYKHLRFATQNLIYISDTPHPLRNIPNCLASSAKADCDKNESSDPRVAGGFIKIDPTPWLCSPSCAAIIDGIVAYRDASHISVAMSQALARPLGEFLSKRGII